MCVKSVRNQTGGFPKRTLNFHDIVRRPAIYINLLALHFFSFFRLTPLYLSVTSKVDPSLTEMLLRDHASIGAADLQGWREAHQACRAGLAAHLEHLIFYGADMNVRNASGNTPLHVCAVNNQESCARLLLFRFVVYTYLK